MKKFNITEDILLQYIFNLLDDKQTEYVTQQLTQDKTLKAKYDLLQSKFKQLDTVADDYTVNDALISKTLATTFNTNNRSKSIFIRHFRNPFLISSVAAIVVICVGLFGLWLNQTPDNSSDKTQTFATAKDAMDAPLESQSDNSMKSRGSGDSLLKGTEQKSFARLSESATTTSHVPATLSMAPDSYSTIDDSNNQDSFSKRPFAPASKIELNVLPNRDSVQLTIYNSEDLTLVREKRRITLKHGWNWIQFMWANTLIDPTSLNLEPIGDASQQVQIEQLVYPAGMKDIGRWLIKSTYSGPMDFEITYFTSGVSWNAFYMATLSNDESSMQLDGYVTVANNSGENFVNAQTRVVVGELHLIEKIAELARQSGYLNERRTIDSSFVNRGEVYKFDSDLDMTVGAVLSYRLEEKVIEKQALSEYYLYSIQGTETINNGWAKRLSSLNARNIPTKSLYKYDESRFGNTVVRYQSFTNDKASNLGNDPIPNGNIKLYANADDTQGLSFIGSSNIKYIPLDEEVQLNLGTTQKIAVEPVLMSYETDSYVYKPSADKKNNLPSEIANFDEITHWQINVTNTRKIPVTIEITRQFGQQFSIENDIPASCIYQKYDNTTGRYTIELQPESKEIIKYKLLKHIDNKGDLK